MVPASAKLHLRLVRLAAVAVLALATGCATSYPVKIEASSAGRPSPGLAYRIEVKGADGMAPLRVEEAAGYVRTALSGRGFYEAPAAGRADVVIEVEFGVESVRSGAGPDRVPIYAELAGGVREETVTVTGPDGKAKTETVRVVVPPRREVIGHQQLVDAVPVYRKFLRVEAREARPQEKDGVTRDLWTVRATSEDRSDDLRRYLPVLASVTMRSLAGEVASGEVRVTEDDPDVAFVRRGL